MKPEKKVAASPLETEEVVIPEEALETEVLAPEDLETAVDFKEQMDLLMREKEEVEDRLLRLQADYDNFRRRTRQEKQEISGMVGSEIIRQILPVIDNFKRALQQTAGTEEESFYNGMELVYRQMMDVLSKLGVEEIAAQGELFDPRLHEAVMSVQDAEQPEGTVLDVFEDGYQIHGRLIRPSKVRVVSHS